jgi:ribosomal protein L18E
VLGDGELDGVTLTVTAHAFSGSARDKITPPAGRVTELYASCVWTGAVGAGTPATVRRR